MEHNHSKKYLVLDTNILLLDANNLLTVGQDGSIVVLPETVIDEIDSKKSGLNELAYQAREFGRLLTKAKKLQNYTDEDLVVTVLEYEGVTIHVVSSTQYPDYKEAAPNIINDRKIIEIAVQYNNIYNDDVTFVTNDVMCRLRAESLGLETQDLKEVENTDFNFTKTMEVPSDLFVALHDSCISVIDPDYKMENYNYVFTSTETAQVKLAYVSSSGLVKVIGKDTEKEIRDTKRQPVPPLNSEQLMMSRAILEPSIDVIVCEALAGSGFN